MEKLSIVIKEMHKNTEAFFFSLIETILDTFLTNEDILYHIGCNVVTYYLCTVHFRTHSIKNFK